MVEKTAANWSFSRQEFKLQLPKSVRSIPKRMNILIANFSRNDTCSITLERQQAHLCHHTVNFSKVSQLGCVLGNKPTWLHSRQDRGLSENKHVNVKRLQF